MVSEYILGKLFAHEIFPLNDEQSFASMFNIADSMTNAPVNVSAGALMHKEVMNMSDDEILNANIFNIQFKVALHTTRMEEQPMSDHHWRFRNSSAFPHVK